MQDTGPIARFAAVASIAAALVFASASAFAGCVPDGATIVNSGSTNTAKYEIKVWSNGRGTVSIADGAPSKFTVPSSVVAKFFTDVKASRANPGERGRCMKSASFGSTTIVNWHGWSSFDLQCPPLSAPVAAVASDVNAITSAAGIGTSHRLIPRPAGPRRMPAEPVPSPSATP